VKHGKYTDGLDKNTDVDINLDNPAFILESAAYRVKTSVCRAFFPIFSQMTRFDFAGCANSCNGPMARKRLFYTHPLQSFSWHPKRCKRTPQKARATEISIGVLKW